MSKIFLFILTILIAASNPLGAHMNQRYSAANAITFKHTKITKDFVGSGFLISHNDKTYAVTAKHVLLETMDQGITSVAVEAHVDHWQLQPFNEDTGVVVLGDLLNANSQEKLGIEVIQNDWLLFDVESNHSSLTPLKLAKQSMRIGEHITVFGCSYSNQKTCQQGQLSGQYIKTTGVNLMIKLETEDMSQLSGLSGAPVLNDNYEVVGIVSNVIPDNDQGGMYFAPFVIDSVLNFLNNQKHHESDEND